MTGSCQSGWMSWPNAVTSVPNSNMNDSAVNQCATATTGRRDMRVWPRNSLASVHERARGASLRRGSACPTR